MKYTVTFACGHTHTVELYGPMDERKRKVAYLETVECKDCKKAKLEAERKAESEAAAQKAKEGGLPELEGSPKQIAWAETLRAEKVEIWKQMMDTIKMDKIYAKFPEVSHESVDAAIAGVKSKMEKDLYGTSAKWFIENRFRSPVKIFGSLLDEELKK